MSRDQYNQVASSVPFDSSLNGFVGDNVQVATEDIRNRYLSSVNSVATTLNGTTTALFTSFTTYIFSGTATGHKLVFPDATTCTIGHNFEIWNLSTQNIDILDNGTNVLTTLKPNARTQIILRDNTTSDGVWVSTYTLDNGNVFGTELYYQEQNAETSNNSDIIWANKITLITPPLPVGDYLSQFQFNWRADNNSRTMQFRIQRAGIDVDLGEPFTGSVDDRQLISGFRRTLGLSGIQTYTLDFRRGANNTTVYMYNARLFIWRVG
jgi:hypothetical protein